MTEDEAAVIAAMICEARGICTDTIVFRGIRSDTFIKRRHRRYWAFSVKVEVPKGFDPYLDIRVFEDGEVEIPSLL